MSILSDKMRSVLSLTVYIKIIFYYQLCLEEYNYEIEKVINAVLEGKLPPSLIDIDKTMKRYENKIAKSYEISCLPCYALNFLKVLGQITLKSVFSGHSKIDKTKI